jgi:hypothetical protein
MAQQLRETIDKWNYMKLKTSAQQKKWFLNWRGYPQNGKKNLCQLYIWQGITNLNIQDAQKTKLPQNQWLNEEMGKWTERVFSKEEVQMALKKSWKNAHHPWP